MELGCPAVRRLDLELCLNEAVLNIIQHGYADDAPHEIEIGFRREPNAVVMRIEDDARPFDPLRVETTQPASLEEAPLFGRGILLFRRTADGVSYEHRDGRNRLELRFAVGAGPPD